MKAIFFLALIVLAASAQDASGFNGGAYYKGFTGKLGLTQLQVQDGQNCFKAVAGIAQQLGGLYQSLQPSTGGMEGMEGMEGMGDMEDVEPQGPPAGTGAPEAAQPEAGQPEGDDFEGSPDFGGEAPQQQGPEAIISALLSLYTQARGQLQAQCLPFLSDILSVLKPNLNNPSMVGLDDDTPFPEIVGINYDFYFPQIVKLFGTWVQQLHDGQFEQAGATNAQIIRVLTGAEIPKVDAPTSVPLGNSVLFNQKNFVSQFFTGLFKTLGFKSTDVVANVKSINSCSDALTSMNTQLANFQKQTATLKFLDAFYATKGLATSLAASFKQCKPAFQLAQSLSQKLGAKVQNSQEAGYQLFLNLSLNFPKVQSDLMAVAVYVNQGRYEVAGNTFANIVKNLFAKVATFPL